ncbi:phosphocholine cytidylyltransferase family protein [Puia dinghuensis]|uniref:Sugar nucleotidyltransferase n=1 Tax=Puia dinghuensis TaxID=1792502 RepID=A0A8J2UBS5_9BACT|nr:phosphocholine cytidylyltransferase family protein [Puia dinghuensis]GGA93262.1 sugar nucleotidyltransferase [Puia dinghuensis]
MNVIIPAAGRGTRLLPLTSNCPKCLVEINDKPILHYLLSDLKKLNVTKVIIVTGYRGEMIREYVDACEYFSDIICIQNSQFDSTNSIVSLALSRTFWQNDFCIIDSDLLLRFDVVEQLIKSNNTCLFIDNTKNPDSIDMKVKVKDERLIYMDKNLSRDETFGEFFGLSHWTPEDAADLSNEIDQLINQNKSDVWYEFAIRSLAQKKKLPIKTCTSDTWFEIDNILDFQKAGSFIKHHLDKT